MVWRLMPAAFATSDSVIDDQSRVSSISRMPSRIESRSSTRDASAYGTRCAVRRSAGVFTPARVIAIPPSLRSPRSRPRQLYHLEVRLRRAAIGTAPVLGDVVPAGAGGDAVLGPAPLLVVLEATLHAHEQLERLTHVATPISSKSIFSLTPQSGQHQASGTWFHGVPAGNPSRAAPLASS